MTSPWPWYTTFVSTAADGRGMCVIVLILPYPGGGVFYLVDEMASQKRCHGACSNIWRPFIAESEIYAVLDGVKEALISNCFVKSVESVLKVSL